MTGNLRERVTRVAAGVGGRPDLAPSQPAGLAVANACKDRVVPEMAIDRLPTCPRRHPRTVGDAQLVAKAPLLVNTRHSMVALTSCTLSWPLGTAVPRWIPPLAAYI